MLKKLNIKKLNQKGFTPHFLDRNTNINLKDINKSAGFSLLEVMIAVAIITAGILGVFGLIVKTTAVGSISNNEVIASNLAQEGIEVVRNIRDTNWLDGSNWYSGIGGAGVGNKWRGIVDYNSNVITTFPGHPSWESFSDCGENCHLKINTGIYSHSVGTNVNFYRMILTDKISADELKIVSKVKWTERGQSRIITVEDRLFDWK